MKILGWIVPRSREQAKRLVGWLCLVIVLAVVVYCAYYRFTHADMTETRLFLQLWPVAIPFFAAGIGFAKWGI